MKYLATMVILGSAGTVAAVGSVGCYTPNIIDGGLVCASGDRCPDGMRCYGGMCFVNEPLGGVDASTPEVAPDLTPELPPVVRQFMEPCDPSNSGTPDRTDNCAPELVCVDGNVGSWCLVRCPTRTECGATTCENRQVDVQVPAVSLVCGLPASTCDPVENSGCPSGQSCYMETGRTICEITTGEGQNTSCLHSRECLPQHTCASSGPGIGRCQRSCSPAGPPCPGATVCQAEGYCF